MLLACIQASATNGQYEALPLGLQGFVLSQYAMLWAAENPGRVERLLMFNTPLNRKTKLRPELAAYKSRLAFTRPDPKVTASLPWTA